MLDDAPSCDSPTSAELEALGEEIATFAARIDVATPDAIFGRGELSYSKARAITRVATAETEQEFIDIALRSTAAQIERMIRAYQRCLDVGDGGETPLSQRRYLRRSGGPGGMVRIEMQLPPEEAALVWEAIISASERGCAESPAEASDPAASDPAASDPAAGEEPQPSEQASDPGEAVEAQASAEASAPRYVPPENREELEQRRADAMVDVARAYLQHRPKTRSSGYELVLITSKEQLEHGHAGVGGFLRDGQPVPLHIARMLACDSAKIDVTVGEHGEVLDVGRSTRTLPSAIGRALWLRDGGCRAPGCARRRHLHGHHIKGWAEGGPTKLSNLVLVCPAHHRMIHQGRLRVEMRDAQIVFVDQQNRAIPAAPPSAATGKALEELELSLREADVRIDPDTNYPQWDGSRLDLGYALDWLFSKGTTVPSQ